MPNRFSTQAANADVMGEDAQPDGTPEGMPHGIGADGTPRDRSDLTPERASQAGESKDGEPKQAEVKPGKGINAAGFVKDKDVSKP